eukprot:SAG11_NODE_10_length_27955_cov_15.365235_18_plen_154_part_00
MEPEPEPAELEPAVLFKPTPPPPRSAANNRVASWAPLLDAKGNVVALERRAGGEMARAGSPTLRAALGKSGLTLEDLRPPVREAFDADAKKSHAVLVSLSDTKQSAWFCQRVSSHDRAFPHRLHRARCWNNDGRKHWSSTLTTLRQLSRRGTS